jgi:hypothetical protein
MDRPSPDPAKLLEAWMEWERGDVTPGRVMATLKTGGLRDLLEAAVARSAALSEESSEASSEEDRAVETGPATETWTPVV